MGQLAMTLERLKIGISTCPNDTYTFHGLLAGESDPQGFEWEFELCDVQTLNERWLAGEFDVAKASFAAALRAGGDTLVLPSGAALGRGVGPVVLAPASERRAHGLPQVLAPGEHTTATLLWRLLHPEPVALRQVVFSEILPALERGEADLGVCIHEGRFVYRQRGLRWVEDLGASWERLSGAALPLGGILARRPLGRERAARASVAIASSLEHARAHPERALVSMRRWAQEHSDEVLWRHVELYVSDETLRLSPEGRRALAELGSRAARAGLCAGSRPLGLSDDPASWSASG